MLSLFRLMFALHPLVAYAFIVASMVYLPAFIGRVFHQHGYLVAGDHRLGSCHEIEGVDPVVVIFIGAWIIQFVGHKIEGKKPSFFEDIQYLWAGPLFALSKLFLKLSIKW